MLTFHFHLQYLSACCNFMQLTLPLTQKFGSSEEVSSECVQNDVILDFHAFEVQSVKNKQTSTYEAKNITVYTVLI